MRSAKARRVELDVRRSLEDAPPSEPAAFDVRVSRAMSWTSGIPHRKGPNLAPLLLMDPYLWRLGIPTWERAFYDL